MKPLREDCVWRFGNIFKHFWAVWNIFSLFGSVWSIWRSLSVSLSVLEYLWDCCARSRNPIILVILSLCPKCSQRLPLHLNWPQASTFISTDPLFGIFLVAWILQYYSTSTRELEIVAYKKSRWQGPRVIRKQEWVTRFPDLLCFCLEVACCRPCVLATVPTRLGRSRGPTDHWCRASGAREPAHTSVGANRAT